ncbi:MAG: hypothetical protein U0871_04285 [Gemmataceae bacterium]
MSSFRWLLAVSAHFAYCLTATAAGHIAVGNSTDRTVEFQLVHGPAKPVKVVLEPGESRAFPVGRQTELGFTAAGKPVRYKLTPYTAYLFTAEDDRVSLHGIETPGRLPDVTDVPEGPPAPQPPLRVTVKVLVDDADVRSKAVAQQAVRERVAAASAILEQQCGVRLDVVEAGDWKSDPRATDMIELLKGFEKWVGPAPADLAIGFTSRLGGKGSPRAEEGTVAGCTRGPLATHILVRETGARTDPEKLEILLHELAHRFGAAHSPDPGSVMRPRLADGLATAARFRIGLDPMNALAVAVWADEIRTGQLKRWDDLRSPARGRLKVIYRALAAATENDTVARDYASMIDRIEERAEANARPVIEPAGGPPAKPAMDPAVKPMPQEVRPQPAPPQKIDLPPAVANDPDLKSRAATDARAEAVRRVVRAVTVRAGDLRQPDAGEKGRGDALTAELIKTAADVASTLPDDQKVAAFLLGLGIALDDSTVLRNNIKMRALCQAAESDEERQERLTVLGTPTVRGRRDLCQHFAVSAALTEELGPTMAEAAGLAKELLDMRRDSGFSFVDLAADYSGVEFAKLVKRNPGHLARVRDGFTVERYVPAITGLREGLNAEQVQEEFGYVDDPRFQAAVEAVRKRVRELEAYRR